MRNPVRLIFLALFGLVAARPAAAAITVTSTSDAGAGSLRQAILDAGPGENINFDPTLDFRTITLTSGPLTIDKDLQINGVGRITVTLFITWKPVRRGAFPS